ncbi:MAG: hypothetical protein IJW20_05610 [Clostridia bacterium]|nr:hypothetical protein [Clostridia bacterium]
MNVLKKYKFFISDMFLNMVGFAIYIIAQQILLLPILAKIVNDEIYSSIVLYISILNVICNVTGGELGNVRLVRDSVYKEKKLTGDFARILYTISPIIAIILFPILLYLKYSVLGSILLIITILMANVRLYSTCFYRLEQKYNKVIWQNVCYLIGIIVSLVIFYFYKNIYLLLLIPEAISVIYAFKNSDLLKMRMQKTSEMIGTIKKFWKLGLVSLLTNMMNYFDKFLIYPMFGATSIAVYYAVNSMAKITSLITNPMSSVILSWVSKYDDEKSKKKIIKMTLLSNIPVILIVTVLTVPLTYIALKVLYSQFVADATVLIIPIAITSAIGTAATLIKSVLLKFSNTNKLVFTYVIYLIVFMLCGYFFSKTKGLVGFTIANLVSKTILLIMFVILLLSIKKEEVKD